MPSLVEVTKLLKQLKVATTVKDIIIELGVEDRPNSIKELATIIRYEGHIVERRSTWNPETRRSTGVLWVLPKN